MNYFSYESDELNYSILDSLSAHIAVLDTQGCIVAVNLAWRKFCSENSQKDSRAKAEEGINYLTVCKNSHGANSEEANQMYSGILSVINKECAEYTIEYPCHSPNQKRWFRAFVTKLPIVNSSNVLVAHINITNDIRNEIELKNRK